MSDREPTIRQRSRPNRANQQTAADDQCARQSQALVEQAIEAALCEPKISSRGGVGETDPASGGDYEVGYRKPPVHSRFKKGHCPNPKGRPKKAKLSMEEQLAVMLDESVTVMKEGKPCRMTVRQVGLQRMAQAFAKGDMKAVSLVTQWESKRQQLASGAADDEGALQEPSQEMRQVMADLKATELLKVGFSEKQVEEALSIFGLPAPSAASDAIIIETPSATESNHDDADDSDEELEASDPGEGFGRSAGGHNRNHGANR
jgi:hypothetical protein